MINVLRLALPCVSVIHPNVKVTCRKFVKEDRNDMGVVEPFWRCFTAVGQVQPQTASEVQNGEHISVAKKVLNIWIKAELHTVDTQQVADQVVFDGKVWNVVSVTNWNRGNGWGNYVVTEDKAIMPYDGKARTVGDDGLVWK